jgi:hypothetical protein
MPTGTNYTAQTAFNDDYLSLVSDLTDRNSLCGGESAEDEPVFRKGV